MEDRRRAPLPRVPWSWLRRPTTSMTMVLLHGREDPVVAVGFKPWKPKAMVVGVGSPWQRKCGLFIYLFLYISFWFLFYFIFFAERVYLMENITKVSIYKYSKVQT